MTSSLSLLFTVLLQMGFTLTLYVTIEAVSSYLAFSSLPTLRRRLFSVALSLRFPSQDVILHLCSVEPGLSSYAAFRHCYTRLFNLLTLFILIYFCVKVKCKIYKKKSLTIQLGTLETSFFVF